MNLKNYYWLFKEDPFEKNFVTDIKKEGLTLRKKHGLVGDPAEQGKKNLKQRKSKVSWINSPLLYGNINPTIHKANANAGWYFQWDWNQKTILVKLGNLVLLYCFQNQEKILKVGN